MQKIFLSASLIIFSCFSFQNSAMADFSVSRRIKGIEVIDTPSGQSNFAIITLDSPLSDSEKNNSGCSRGDALAIYLGENNQGPNDFGKELFTLALISANNSSQVSFSITDTSERCINNARFPRVVRLHTGF